MNKIKTAYNSVYAPLLCNSTYTQNVMRKAEHKMVLKTVEFLYNNPAPRTPAIHGELKNKRGAIK